ncbi:MAG: peptidylprolyl isomerase [Chromatiales bacterium]|nr:peptidylprolyl isomerase [Chromatiales bacterium]
MVIQKNRVVTLEYTLRDEEGNILDTTDGGEPFSYIHGSDDLFTAMEAQLEGHASGERLQFLLSPDEAYGERDERLVKTVPRDRFNTEMEIQAGMSFSRGEGDEAVEVRVVAVDEEGVTIDANPPLAGVTLQFDLVITAVREAGSEELESGRVASIDEIYSQ